MLSAPRRRPRIFLTACVTFLALLAIPAADSVPRPGVVRIDLADPEQDLKLLREMRIDVDGVFDGWARAYVWPEEAQKLRRLGLELTALPDEGLEGLARLAREGLARGAMPGVVPAQYHDYDSLTLDLQTIAADHSDIVRLTSIGRSIQDRELWMVKITANPDVEEDEPEFLFIAAMHGDEVVGKEMTFNLINHLTDRYGLDPQVNRLVNGAEIWIMPSMNPDGTAMGQRYNANSVDLNRDFPDWFDDPVNTAEGRQTETSLVMSWVSEHQPILGGSFHGGALVVNYQMDNNETGSSVFSPAPDPDHAAFHSISLSYAENNPPMYNSPSFENGVTNGAEWYAISGGVQDWSYCWYSNFLVTLEISNNKWPAASQLPQFWEENRDSMLAYFDRGLEGVRGRVTDAETGAPLAARVHIDDNPFPSYTDPDAGDYHRVVLPGSYSLSVAADGYETQTFPVVLTGGAATRYDVALLPLPTDLQHTSSRIDDGAFGNGWLDPGEPVDLLPTLENIGRTATGITASLVPTGWFTEVLRAEATYPDIAPGGSAESDAPGFRFRLAADVPTGYKAGFAVAWTSAESSGITEPFFLDHGPPNCQTTHSTEVPLPIQDNQTVISRTVVWSDEQIQMVQVPVDISHSYIGDLTIELISPSGTHVMLHDRSGGSTNDIVGTYGDDLTPAQSLDALVDEMSVGTWQLVITDHAGSDTGTLNAWGVEICGRPADAATPEMRLRDLDVLPGGVQLRWWVYPGMLSYKVYRSDDPSSAGAFIDVTAEDGDDTDTVFLDTSSAPLSYYLVTGVGPAGEGPR